MAGISSRAAGGIENKRKFNDGTELENKEFSDGVGLDWYATTFRSQDPQLGRFWQVDPLAEIIYNNSTYVYVSNNPISINDPTGLCDNDSVPLSFTPPQKFSFDKGFPLLASENGSTNNQFNTDLVNNKNKGSKQQNSQNTNVSQPSNNNSAQGNGGVGQPGDWERIIPVWGSGRAAVDHFQNGNYWRRLGYTALAISDVFLVKSIATGIGRGAWKLGSHSWSATRKWLGKNGYAESGQHVHHWAVHQATAKKYGLEAVTNQPWNLMPMSSPALHQSIHGVGPNAFEFMGQFWYGTPTWFKAGMFSGGGRIID